MERTLHSVKRQSKKDFATEVEDTAAVLRQYWLERAAPPIGALQRARRLFHVIPNLIEPPSDATEAHLDSIDGLIIWGELMLAIARLDPQWLASSRREERARAADRAELLQERARRESMRPPLDRSIDNAPD